ncbi:hypothetical protein BS47DRAFT_1369673 [Hydnum rufescens UP504]|uniref:Uncharacterized protein n=1 Tax=Hydnum rufescens UP504 TaxID=1448309 RepID=A0A9P6ADB1_9AGAM|nr:hypothetical protein BS47DRAFT_1369673 [Hydnum rufescens UP504]
MDDILAPDLARTPPPDPYLLPQPPLINPSDFILCTEEDPLHPFFPWKSHMEFKVVAWMTDTALSQAHIDHFLNLEYVQKNNITLSFTSAKEMHHQTENAMANGPLWKSQVVMLEEAGDEPQIMFFCDPVQCAQELFGNPLFSGEMDYKAIEVFKTNGVTHIYHEMVTGKLWNKTQGSIFEVEGATLGGIILSLDKTHLSVFSGSKVMHPIYMILGNIQKHV